MEKTLQQKKTFAALAPVLLVALSCVTPGLYLYCRNAYEASFVSVLPVLAASAGLGLVCLLLLWLVTKNLPLSALIATAAMGLFLNFNFIVDLCDRVLPGSRVRTYYLVAAGVFALLLGAILLVKKAGVCDIAGRLLLIVFAVVLLLNLVTAAPQIARKWKATAYTASNTGGERKDLPNFYYLIVDEYASFQELEQYYGYDNAAFRDFLTERGFDLSDSSYNRFPSTLKSLADNVNLGPVSSGDMQTADCQELVNNGALYGVLEKLGYNLSQLGAMYPLPKLLEKGSFGASADAATMNGETAAEILINNSMLMPLKSIRYWSKIGAEGDMALFSYLDDPAHYGAKNNQAVFFYICCPHPPFYYTAEGGEVPEADWTNWTDKSFYLGQLQYVTTRLQTAVDTILTNDPGAIILIQSDHGLRYHVDSDLPMDFAVDADSERRILNVLYFSGEDVDIEGLSGYNTLRFLLTKLGLDYPVLPEQ